MVCLLWMASLAPGEIGTAEGELVYSGRAGDAEDGIAILEGENLADNGSIVRIWLRMGFAKF